MANQKIFVNILRNYLELIHFAHLTSNCLILDSEFWLMWCNVVTIISMIDSKRGETSFSNNIDAYLMNKVQGIWHLMSHLLAGPGWNCKNIYLTSCQCDKHHNMLNLDQAWPVLVDTEVLAQLHLRSQDHCPPSFLIIILILILGPTAAPTLQIH